MTLPKANELGAPKIADLLADTPQLDDIKGELLQLDAEPLFDASADPEVDEHLRLEGDLRYKRTPSRRLYVDYRPNMEAYAHLADLPAKGESLHGIISGKYALFELIPALIERTGQKIADLYIATLSFSKQNAADLLGLLDDQHVKAVNLIISYYFKSTSRPIYDALIPQLRERDQKVIAIRNHAKMLLAEMVDGTKYVVESSANLRSSQNIEQFSMSQDEGLFAFHRGWMRGEILDGVELGKDEKAKNPAQ